MCHSVISQLGEPTLGSSHGTKALECCLTPAEAGRPEPRAWLLGWPGVLLLPFRGVLESCKD